MSETKAMLPKIMLWLVVILAKGIIPEIA